MGAQRGTLTFTRLFVRGKPPRDLRQRYLQAIRHRAFQPLTVEGEAEEATGWCVIDRVFDLEFDLDKIFHDRYLLLGLRVDRWRLPSALLKAHLAEEERKFLEKHSQKKLTRAQKQELKHRVTVRLRRKVVPSSKSVDLCWDLDSGVVLFFSHSQRLLTDFAELFEKTFELAVDEDTPYLAATRASLPFDPVRALRHVEPLSFSSARRALQAAQGEPAAGSKATKTSPSGEAADGELRAPSKANGKGKSSPHADEASEGEARPAKAPKAASAPDADAGEELSERVETTRFLGCEFLLWIWMRAELLETTVELREFASCETWIDNHLILESIIDPNERATLRGASPTASGEAKEALRAQKTPVKAKLTLRLDERDYALTLIGQRFALSGATLPAVMTENSDDAFLERMYLVEQLTTGLDRLFEAFMSVRLAPAWAEIWEPSFMAWLEQDAVPAALLQKLAAKPRRSRASSAERRA